MDKCMVRLGDPHMWQMASRVSALGIEIAMSVGLGTWAGSWFDKHYDLSPYGLLIGFALGLSAAGLGVKRTLTALRATTKESIKKPSQKA